MANFPRPPCWCTPTSWRAMIRVFVAWLQSGGDVLIDTNLIAEGFLDPIIRVVEQMLEQAPELDPNQVMLVGAWCRDTLRSSTMRGHCRSTLPHNPMPDGARLHRGEAGRLAGSIRMG